MKVKIDYKQILMEKGERIGLIAAGALAFLLLLSSLFWPGHGLFAGSPAEKAKVIEETANWVDARLKDPSNLPTDADKPTKEAQQQLIAYDPKVVDPAQFAMAQLIPAPTSVDQGRRVPRVFAIAEGRAGADRVNIRSYIFQTGDPVRIRVILKDAAGPGTPPPTPQLGGRLAAALAGRDLSKLPPRVRRMLGLPADAGADDGKKDGKTDWIPLADLDKNTDKTLAEQIRPSRIAVIAASFPYKKQIEEFRAKLAMRSNDEVLKDMSLEKDRYGTVLPSFRFLGVNVQRREVDGDGKPATPWVDVDVNEAYKPFVFLTGSRFEPEDPDLAPVAFRGLVMGKLQQFSTDIKPADNKGPMAPPGPGVGMPATTRIDPSQDKYPKVEKKLKLLAQTVEAIKAKGATAQSLAPTRFRLDDLDAFAPPPAAAAPGAGAPPPREGVADPLAPAELPDYCLVRVIDVTVEAGKTYEYQIQVRMGNPNFGRRDVASTKYAEAKELVSEWTKIPDPVNITPDLYYYAVDQKDLHEGRERYKGPYMKGDYAPGSYSKDQILFMQAHRWVNTVKMRSGPELIVGDWVAIERFPVRRGDYVGHREKVDVPYWKYAREGFVVAKDVDADFGYHAPNTAQPEAILVDFDSGRHGYSRDGGRPVVDAQGIEALLLNPDGKLILLEGAKDVGDSERTDRLKEIQKRIENVRSGKTPGAGGKGPGFTG